MENNTAGYNVDQFMKNIANNLNTLVNNEKAISILVSLQKIVNTMIKSRLTSRKLISKPDLLLRPENFIKLKNVMTKFGVK